LPQPISHLLPYTTLFRSPLRIPVLGHGLSAGDLACVTLPMAKARGFSGIPELLARCPLELPGYYQDTSHMCWTHDDEHFTQGSRSEEHTSELQSRGHLVC